MEYHAIVSLYIGMLNSVNGGSKATLARINGGFGVSLPAFYGYLVDETPEANLASDSCDGKLVDTNFE